MSRADYLTAVIAQNGAIASANGKIGLANACYARVKDRTNDPSHTRMVVNQALIDAGISIKSANSKPTKPSSSKKSKTNKKSATKQKPAAKNVQKAKPRKKIAA